MDLIQLRNYLLDSTGFVHLQSLLPEAAIFSAAETVFEIQQHYFQDGRPRKFGFLDESSDPMIFLKLVQSPELRKLLAFALGPYFRLDSAFALNQPYDGGTGENLHGGPGSGQGMHMYARQAGKTVCGQISVGIPLQQPRDDQGGLVYLPGSHKSDFPFEGGAVLTDLKAYGETARLLRPQLKLGDVVVFPETLIHGAMPVNEPRLSLYFMFTAGHVCYRSRSFSDRVKRAAAAMGLTEMLSPAYVSCREKYEGDEIRRSPTVVD